MSEEILILHLETSSTVCSVGLSFNEEIIAIEEVNDGYTHAENLHVFIDRICKRSSFELNQLHAVAVSTGPGSYTGLRIGMSAAKGLCHALQLPLIGISTLSSLCRPIRDQFKKSYYIPMLDARRMEVYFGVYDFNLNEVVKPSPLVINEQSVALFNDFPDAVYFGSGVSKCTSFLEVMQETLLTKDVLPSVRNMVGPGIAKFRDKDFLDLAYCEPEYLKDFFDTRKAQKE